MAGSDPRFSAAQFRTAIKFAMQMGFPQDSAKQITWHWLTERTFAKPDSTGLPFEWTTSQVETSTTITDLIVDCAVKFTPPSGTSRVGGTPLGVMDVASATATLLDTDYDALITHGGRFPDQALMDGNVYVTQIKAPPYGLFEVTVYDILLQAVDES